MNDLIIELGFFENKCVIVKGLLQSEQLKRHMVIIGVDQSSSNIVMYKHRCMEKLRSYTKNLENSMINNSTRKLLNHKCY